MEVTLEQVAGQIADISKRLFGFEEDTSKRLSGFEEDTSKRLSRIEENTSKRLSGFEERLTTAVNGLKHQAVLNMEALKQEVKAAGEGYGATLEGIERELIDLSKKIDTKFGDHDLVLADHNQRILKLEKR